jgi:hypothetical protein
MITMDALINLIYKMALDHISIPDIHLANCISGTKLQADVFLGPDPRKFEILDPGVDLVLFSPTSSIVIVSFYSI